MNGNFVNNCVNKEVIKYSDVEYFILGLLNDIIETSNNPILSNSTVNTFGDYNLSDLSDENIKMLVTFRVNKEDPRNAHLFSTATDENTTLKIVYEIGVISLRECVKSFDFALAFEEIIDACTANVNSEPNTTEINNYIANVPSGISLSTPLTLNEKDPLPDITMRSEETQDKNYLTGTTNIVFIVSKG